MLAEGSSFPEFALQDQHGETITLASLKGKRTVMYFYPKDDTSGCTAEACELNERMPRFAELSTGSVDVIGVSPDSVKSHKKFADKFGLNFRLLADIDHKLAEECGVWIEKSMYGRKYMGVDRTTFVLDESGNVVKAFPKVKPQGHAEEILSALGTI